jgi:hypothetical protein
MLRLLKGIVILNRKDAVKDLVFNLRLEMLHFYRSIRSRCYASPRMARSA